MKSEYHPQYTLTVTAKELKLISLALVGGLKDKEDLEAAARLNLGLMSMAHKCVQEQAVSMGNAHQRARDAVGKYKKEEESDALGVPTDSP